MRFSRFAAVAFLLCAVTVSAIVYDRQEFSARLESSDSSRSVISCVTDPCPGGYNCVGEVCVADDECQNHADCGEGQRCWSGTCGPECLSDGDCQGNTYCNGGQCSPCVALRGDCANNQVCCGGEECVMTGFTDTNGDGEGDTQVLTCGGLSDESGDNDPVVCCDITEDTDPGTQQFLSYACRNSTAGAGCPQGQYPDMTSCQFACKGETVSGDIGGGSDCWLPTCPAGFCFPDGNSAPDGSCNQGSYPTEAACVAASFDICNEQYNDISYGGYIPPQMTLGGGGGVGSGTGDSGGTGLGVDGGDEGGTKECGANTCMSADNCALFDGTCLDACSKGCCCVGERLQSDDGSDGSDDDAPGNQQGSAGTSSGTSSKKSAASGGSDDDDDPLHGAANSSDAARGIGCSPYLTYDCPVCPNGVTQRFSMTSTGFLATELNECVGDAECAKRNDEFFMEYRGDCQWSTNQGGQACALGSSAPEWAMTIDPGKNDGKTVTIYERGGAVYSGWTQNCEFPMALGLTRPSDACDVSYDSFELYASCQAAEYPSSAFRLSSISRSSFSSQSSSSASTQRLSSSRSSSSSGLLALGFASTTQSAAALPSPNNCGDGACATGEDTVICPEDCRCGDDVCSATENANICADDCASICGNGIVELSEQCDDGIYNAIDTPGICRMNCLRPVCGDGIRDTDEACDDGNREVADACANDCLLGVRESCSGDSVCASGICASGRCLQSDLCGNGVREEKEWCDDGNLFDDDACTSACTRSDGQTCDDSVSCASGLCRNGICIVNGRCGDGIVDRALGEMCDQGMANSNVIANRCRINCLFARLGDGVLDSGEACDDGNFVDGDGCSSEGVREEVAADPILIELPRPADIFGTPFLAGVMNDTAAQQPTVLRPVLVRAPQGDLNNSGPAALVFMASGASVGYAWLRRRRA